MTDADREAFQMWIRDEGMWCKSDRDRRAASTGWQARGEHERARAAKAEPLAWIGKNPRTHDPVVTAFKPTASVTRDFGMRPLYAAPPPAPDHAALIAEAKEFLQPCEIAYEHQSMIRRLVAALGSGS